jgi:hypothetical protein
MEGDTNKLCILAKRYKIKNTSPNLAHFIGVPFLHKKAQ